MLPTPEKERFTLPLRFVSLREECSLEERKLKFELEGLKGSTTPRLTTTESRDDSMLCLLLEGVKWDALSIFSPFNSSWLVSLCLVGVLSSAFLFRVVVAFDTREDGSAWYCRRIGPNELVDSSSPCPPLLLCFSEA